MRLSDQSLNLSSAFSQSLKEPTDFSFIRKPRNLAQERRLAAKKQHELESERQTHAFDVYGDAATLVYREKTETGSYRIKKESIGQASSRGSLLEMRAKKTSDKYC